MKKYVALLLSIIILVASFGCATGSAPPPGGSATATTASSGGTATATTVAATTANASPKILRVGEDMSSLITVNSLHTTYNNIFESSDAMSDQLIAKDPYTLELQPALLTKMPDISADGKTFTFELKQGVKFHNGDELTAKDCVFTFNRFFDPAYGNMNTWMADMILGAKEMVSAEGTITALDSVKFIDDYHFSIELEYGYTAFLAVLAVAPLNIVPMDACLAAGDRWGIDVYYGTGPFMFKSFEPGVKLVMEKNPNYHGTAAKIDQIEVTHMEPSTALIEWEAGTIDVCAVDVSLVDGYLDDPEFADNVKFQEYVGIHTLNFNQELKPLDDVRVRTAIGLATNSQALCDGYFKGHIRPAKSLIPQGIVGYDDSLPPLEYNPDRAKELLAEAGYPDGIEITCTVRDTSSWVEIYQVLQEQYKLANITLHIEKVDAAGWLEKRGNGLVQFYMMNWYADFLDPDNFIYSLYHSSVADFFSTGNKDPEFDAALDAGRLLSYEAKQQYYADMEYKLSRETVAEWPLYAPAGYILVSDRVDNFFLKRDFLKTYITCDIIE